MTSGQLPDQSPAAETSGQPQAAVEPTLSTTPQDNFFSARRVARITILIALSAVGAFVKIPSPTGTVALDAAPAFLAAAIFSPVEGAIIGLLGHLISALTTGFPLGLPVHLLIAAEMALYMWVFGVLTRKTNIWLASVVAVVLNAVVGAASMIPIGGTGMFAVLLLPLLVGAAINVAVAVISAFALSSAGLADHQLTRKRSDER